MNSQVRSNSYGIRNKENKINISTAVMLIIYTVVSAAYIPSALFADAAITSGYFFGLLAAALAIIGILLCVRITGSFKGLGTFCLLSAFVLFMAGSLKLAAIFPIFFTAICISACLIKELRSPLLLVIPLLSFGAAYFMTRSLFFSSLSLIVFPIAYCLYVVFSKGHGKVSAICSLSFVTGAFLIIYLLCWIYLKDGSIGITTIKAFVASLRGGLISKLADSLVFAYSQISETGIGINYATEISTSLVASVFNFIPALFVLTMYVISYVLHALYVSLMVAQPENAENVKKAMTFKMSATSAVVYMVAFVATLILAYDGSELYATVAQNVSMILQPGLILVAFAFMSEYMRGKNTSCLGFIAYLAVFFLLFNIPSLVLTVASFAGSTIVIISYFKNKKKERDKNQDNGSH